MLRGLRSSMREKGEAESSVPGEHHRFRAPRLVPPYVIFSRAQWTALRDNTTLALSGPELAALAGVNNPTSLGEAMDIFLPLVRLIELHITAARNLSGMVEHAFTGQNRVTSPYVIAIAGSVAVGKSTFARMLRTILAGRRKHLHVDLVATDGFLYPTRFLQANGLMGRKGFPESYDLRNMLTFLEGVKGGAPRLTVPSYSHEAYDVVPGEFQTVDRPDILIFEGLNVLQTANSHAVVASDFFDFTIYLDAAIPTIEQWYVDRFLKLQRTVFQRETSFFHHYKNLRPDEARGVAREIWQRINLPNLVNNIEPARRRARVVMRKGDCHRVEEIWLRQN